VTDEDLQAAEVSTPLGGTPKHLREMQASQAAKANLLSSEANEPAVTPPPGNPRFPLVDGVRAIAALSIVVFHSANPGGWLGAYRYQFAAGVPIFFMISGFLLYRPFVSSRLSGANPVRIRDFARRRLLRIVPAYWVALTALAIFPGLDGRVFSSRAPIYYGFLQTFFPSTAFHGLFIAWSLSTEMTFYLLLPVYALALAYFISMLGKERTLQTELSVLALFSLGSFVFRQLVFGSHWNLAHTIAGTFDWFAVGMAMAAVSAVSSHCGSTPQFIRFVERHPSLFWAGALFAMTVSAVYSKFTHRFDPYSGGMLHYLWALIAVCVVLPAVFGGAAKGAPLRVLSAPFVAWLGLVSYGIFLWHAPIISEVQTATSRWFRLNPTTGFGYVTVLLLSGSAAIGLGAASYYLVERPVLTLKEGRRRRSHTDR
jgi:peptidoglycan/LPS O-acetylase OafA/YrhL